MKDEEQRFFIRQSVMKIEEHTTPVYYDREGNLFLSY